MAPQPQGPLESATPAVTEATKCPFAAKDYPPMAPIPASRKRLPRMSTGKVLAPEKITTFIRPDLPSRCTWMPNMDNKASPHLPYQRYFIHFILFNNLTADCSFILIASDFQSQKSKDPNSVNPI